jgi:hypothetical protein
MTKPQTLPGLTLPPATPRKTARDRLQAALGARWDVATDPSAASGRGLLFSFDEGEFIFNAIAYGSPRAWTLWDGRGDTIGVGLSADGMVPVLRGFVGEEGAAVAAKET